jgi:hypothetical protein
MAVNLNNGYRYYVCLRHKPHGARRQGAPICSLPSVPADDALDADGNPRGLEAEAWRVVRDKLLDEEYLRVGLEQARQASQAALRRREQIEHLSAEIANARRALDKQTVELLLAESGSATEAALRKAGRELEANITAWGASLAALEARPVPGLSDDDAQAIRQLAAEIRAGLDLATPAQRHWVYKRLQLRGTVREDPERGIPLHRRRFTIDWTTLLELRHETTRFTRRPGT